MSYHLRAVIARDDLARQVATAFGADTRAVPLAQGFALVPYTDQVHDRPLASAASETTTFAPFWWLSTTAARLLRGLSHAGALAYVEAEYFGGIGTQHAITWRDAATAYGPAGTPDHAPAMRGDTPISSALRVLGVPRTGAARDQFDTLGLGRHRQLEDWLDKPHTNR